MSNRNYEASLRASVTPTFEASWRVAGALRKERKRNCEGKAFAPPERIQILWLVLPKIFPK